MRKHLQPPLCRGDQEHNIRFMTRLNTFFLFHFRIPGSREELELKVAEANKKVFTRLLHHILDILEYAYLKQVASLTETLHKKETEMAGMEERYKKYIEKAKSVIKTLDPKQNPNAAPEVSALKTQLQDKDKVHKYKVWGYTNVIVSRLLMS